MTDIVRIPDGKLDDLATTYRMLCGQNDVLILGGRVLTFEQYLIDHYRWESIQSGNA